MQQKILVAFGVIALLAFIPGGDCGRNRRQSGFYAQPQNRCETACSFEFSPLCGQNGRQQRTFSNMCAFNNMRCKNSNWKILRKGECPVKVEGFPGPISRPQSARPQSPRPQYPRPQYSRPQY